MRKSDHAEFWINKISKNRLRDDEVNKKLNYLGWKVIRFWGNEIKKNPYDCIQVIEEAIYDSLFAEEYE